MKFPRNLSGIFGNFTQNLPEIFITFCNAYKFHPNIKIAEMFASLCKSTGAAVLPMLPTLEIAVLIAGKIKNHEFSI